MKFTLGFTLVAAASMFATTASAHGTGYYHDHNDGDQLAGAAIGAVAGGLLGSAIAGNSSNTEGTIAGAVIGGIAGAAIADGGSNRGYSNGGYYNSSTGYYGGGGYYNQGTGYYSPGYRTSYPTTYYGGTRYYNNGGYYSRPRSNISINIGSGGYYGHRPYYRGGHHYRRNRGYYGHRPGSTDV